MKFLGFAVHIIILCYGYLIAGSIGFTLGGIIGMVIAIATAPLSILFAVVYLYVTVGNIVPFLIILFGILMYLVSVRATAFKKRSVYELIDD